MKYTVELEQTEVFDVLHTILCDGLYGLSSAGLTLEFEDADYQAARVKITNPCREDVWLQILKDGKSITFTDNEGSEDDAVLTLAKAIEGLKNPEIADEVRELVEGDYDANTGDKVIQYILFGELVYG